MQILISVNGEDQVQRRFQAFDRNLSRTAPMFATIAGELAKSNRRMYGRGVKLAPTTVQIKQEQDYPEPLVKSGRLKQALTTVEGGEGAVREVLPGELRFGTSLYYARFLQHGTRKMLRHRVFRVTPTVRRKVKELIAEHLMRGTRL